MFYCMLIMNCIFLPEQKYNNNSIFVFSLYFSFARNACTALFVYVKFAAPQIVGEWCRRSALTKENVMVIWSFTKVLVLIQWSYFFPMQNDSRQSLIDPRNGVFIQNQIIRCLHDRGQICYNIFTPILPYTIMVSKEQTHSYYA